VLNNWGSVAWSAGPVVSAQAASLVNRRVLNITAANQWYPGQESFRVCAGMSLFPPKRIKRHLAGLCVSLSPRSSYAFLESDPPSHSSFPLHRRLLGLHFTGYPDNCGRWGLACLLHVNPRTTRPLARYRGCFYSAYTKLVNSQCDPSIGRRV
jgi:hypothetical protein